MTIHSEHPFREPDSDQVRRLRGRVGATVSLWTSGRAGLTVSSYVVVTGDPGRVVAALDPDSDLVDALRKTGTGVVQLLRWEDRDVADAFAGTMPAPGGPFRTAEFVDTDYGPRLAAATSWAGVRLEDEREVGWSTLVTVTVAEVHLGDNEDWLVHRGGRYQRPAGH
jgi:flavin reductase (DIM6/NTAB) family NADH-FMN oxidoreductase RutF